MRYLKFRFNGRTITMLMFLSVIITSCQKQTTMQLASPDGKLVVDAWMADSNQLFYQVKLNANLVIEPSRLGIIRQDADFSSGLKWKQVSPINQVNDKYTLKVHKKAEYSYQANQQTITVNNSSGEEMQVIFQVSDHGVAFRYYFPANDSTKKVITTELSSFALNKDARAWLQPCSHAKTSWGNCNPSYEENYLQNIPVGTPSPLAGWVFPALFKTGENWVLISETAVDRNYCASRLQANSTNGIYKIGFPEAQEVVFTGELNPQSKLPWYTPWRIMAIGTLADVTESSLGTDLANPAVQGDFSWVKPGRSSWSWVILKDGETTYPVQKEFIDYAADMGWEYCLIDAYWDSQIGYDKIADLAKYAISKNVKVNLWYNSSGDWNTTPLTPKSALLTHDARIKEFTRIKEMGIGGVKIDFFGGDGQSVMNHYIDILEDAAQVGLQVVFHGCTLPRGWQRTYPHLMTMEAIKGMEFATFTQENMDVVAKHCATIPFTRNVFDPMDFTPTCFGDVPNIKRGTTNGFELALPILFQSGIQHYAEIPADMKIVPDYVKQLMKDIPVVWDETKLVDGFPAEYIVMARRSGDKWYVAGINAKDSALHVSLNLAFIGNKKTILVTDGATERAFTKTDINIDPTKQIEIDIIPHGGFLIQTN